MHYTNLITASLGLLLLPATLTLAAPANLFAPPKNGTIAKCSPADFIKLLNFTIPVGPLTADQIIIAAPELKDRCAKPRFGAAECSRPETVAHFLDVAFEKHGINSWGHKVAVLANMAFESAGFTANTNQGMPKPPGQGTKAMLGFHYVARFIASFPGLSAQITTPTPIDVEKLTWANYNELVPAERQRSMLASVLGDEYTFQSGPWFFHTQCGLDVKISVAGGGAPGFERYLTNCLYAGKETMEARTLRWCRAALAVTPVEYHDRVHQIMVF
ncbi:hypothetical protein DFH27DRAFT_520743 [Peziza echinospora]|nr:hypothetical protein DFH27DRAFT_520743 [Peziza echinospora]